MMGYEGLGCEQSVDCLLLRAAVRDPTPLREPTSPEISYDLSVRLQ